ncbi:hypothetical protein SeMB42_g06342 [Synchytrium endobioticum]|uniref:Protein ZIP4 homolog n=1 Tax=Synchytrium endobioticum TaxID=286115 RepID=A0A507CIX1_9FUNG|nr:hypothetical protein SeMB42_g06342 [Synchytrium endobioticum]
MLADYLRDVEAALAADRSGAMGLLDQLQWGFAHNSFAIDRSHDHSCSSYSCSCSCSSSAAPAPAVAAACRLWNAAIRYAPRDIELCAKVRLVAFQVLHAIHDASTNVNFKLSDIGRQAVESLLDAAMLEPAMSIVSAVMQKGHLRDKSLTWRFLLIEHQLRQDGPVTLDCEIVTLVDAKENELQWGFAHNSFAIDRSHDHSCSSYSCSCSCSSSAAPAPAVAAACRLWNAAIRYAPRDIELCAKVRLVAFQVLHAIHDASTNVNFKLSDIGRQAVESLLDAAMLEPAMSIVSAVMQKGHLRDKSLTWRFLLIEHQLRQDSPVTLDCEIVTLVDAKENEIDHCIARLFRCMLHLVKDSKQDKIRLCINVIHQTLDLARARSIWKPSWTDVYIYSWIYRSFIGAPEITQLVQAFSEMRKLTQSSAILALALRAFVLGAIQPQQVLDAARELAHSNRQWSILLCRMIQDLAKTDLQLAVQVSCQVHLEPELQSRLILSLVYMCTQVPRAIHFSKAQTLLSHTLAQPTTSPEVASLGAVIVWRAADVELNLGGKIRKCLNDLCHQSGTPLAVTEESDNCDESLLENLELDAKTDKAAEVFAMCQQHILRSSNPGTLLRLLNIAYKALTTVDTEDEDDVAWLIRYSWNTMARYGRTQEFLAVGYADITYRALCLRDHEDVASLQQKRLCCLCKLSASMRQVREKKDPIYDLALKEIDETRQVIERLGNASSKRDHKLVESLILYEFECHIGLKAFAELKRIVKAADADSQGISTKVFERMAGLAIHSDCPSGLLFGIVQAVLDCLLKRGKLDMGKVCKWFRLLLEIAMDGSLESTENLFRQVYTIMQFNADTYPQDELLWLAISCWNFAMRIRSSDEENGSFSACELALGFAKHLKDSGMYDQLRVAYDELKAGSV